MKKYSIILTSLLLNTIFVFAKNDVVIVSPSSQAAQGLDLMAVSEIFKTTSNLESFEQSINDSELGINNLDLDNNGYVDFIRVVEERVGDTHVIILQAVIGVDEFQDVATIEIEKFNDQYNMQIHGHEVIYGANYYLTPNHGHVRTWPIISWIYRPMYQPYHSPYYFGKYPRLWRPLRPVHINAYRSKTVKLTLKNTFVVTKNRKVKAVTRVNYKPRTSARVTRNLNVKRPQVTKVKTTQKTGVKKTNAKGTKVTKTKRVKKTTHNATGKTTVRKVKKKTIKKNN